MKVLIWICDGDIPKACTYLFLSHYLKWLLIYWQICDFMYEAFDCSLSNIISVWDIWLSWRFDGNISSGFWDMLYTNTLTLTFYNFFTRFRFLVHRSHLKNSLQLNYVQNGYTGHWGVVRHTFEVVPLVQWRGRQRWIWNR